MKLVKGTIVVLGLAVLAVSCKKEPLPEFPNGDGVIYRISGNVDGEEKALEVGFDNVVMNHGVSDENGMPTYFGEVEMQNTGEKMRISYTRLEKWKDSPTDIRIFTDYSVPFLVHKSGTFHFDFGTGNQNEFMQIQNENGVFVNVGHKTLHEYGVYHVKARFTGLGADSYDFDLRHGYEYEGYNPSYRVETANNVISLYANTSDESLSHEWYINYELVSEESTYVGEIGNGVHEILHIIRDQNGNAARETGLVRFKGGKEFWTMNLKYEEDETFERSNYGRVMLSYFKDGEWYYSKYSDSNIGNEVNIDSVRFVPEMNDYIPVVAFDFDFDAYLVNESNTDSLELSDFNGKFSVGLE